MPVYCVSYDLNRPGQDYPKLEEAIKACPGWWHHLDSTWLVYTEESAAALSGRLRAAMDKNDGLLVIVVGKDHGGWLPAAAWTWITQHV